MDHYGPAGRAKLELKKPAYENVLMDVEMILMGEKVDENTSYMASVFHTIHHNFTVKEMKRLLEWMASPLRRKLLTLIL